jgi:hypothetical protein
MTNFNVEIVDISYMFRLLQSNHNQSVYKNIKRKSWYTYLVDYISALPRLLHKYMCWSS